MAHDARELVMQGRAAQEQTVVSLLQVQQTEIARTASSPAKTDFHSINHYVLNQLKNRKKENKDHPFTLFFYLTYR
jgi:hypothetical protein